MGFFIFRLYVNKRFCMVLPSDDVSHSGAFGRAQLSGVRETATAVNEMVVSVFVVTTVGRHLSSVIGVRGVEGGRGGRVLKATCSR